MIFTGEDADRRSGNRWPRSLHADGDAFWAQFGPGGVWLWAVSLAQPFAVGLRAQAGAVKRPRAAFYYWAEWLVVNSKIFLFSFGISEVI